MYVIGRDSETHVFLCDISSRSPFKLVTSSDMMGSCRSRRHVATGRRRVLRGYRGHLARELLDDVSRGVVAEPRQYRFALHTLRDKVHIMMRNKRRRRHHDEHA